MRVTTNPFPDTRHKNIENVDNYSVILQGESKENITNAMNIETVGVDENEYKHKTATSKEIVKIISDQPITFVSFDENETKKYRQFQDDRNLNYPIKVWLDSFNHPLGHPVIVSKEIAQKWAQNLLNRSNRLKDIIKKREDLEEILKWKELSLFWHSLKTPEIMDQIVDMIQSWFTMPYVDDYLVNKNWSIDRLEEQAWWSYFSWLNSKQDAAVHTNQDFFSNFDRYVWDPFKVFEELKEIAGENEIFFLWVDSTTWVTSGDHMWQANLLSKNNDALPLLVANVYRNWSEWFWDFVDPKGNITKRAVPVKTIYSRVIPWSLRKLEKQFWYEVLEDWSVINNWDLKRQSELVDFFTDSKLQWFGHPILEILINKLDMEEVIKPWETVKPWHYFAKQIDGNSWAVYEVTVRYANNWESAMDFWNDDKSFRKIVLEKDQDYVVEDNYVYHPKIKAAPLLVPVKHKWVVCTAELRFISGWWFNPAVIMAARVGLRRDVQSGNLAKTNVGSIVSNYKNYMKQAGEYYDEKEIPFWYHPVFIQK